LKKILHKNRVSGVAQGVSPEFKSSSTKKKERKKERKKKILS
jgi:hypothetical protein